ncbi:MAG TPA: hypothetical protein VK716_10980 [Terracidiphilus sp.]|jgi:hypothetical protein|nr:hypothetical protein [Terracidiphilus sp.]
MVRAGLILIGVTGALIMSLMIGTQMHWIMFGPCGPDLPGFLLLGGAFLAATSGLLLLLVGFFVSGIRKARSRAAV